MNEETKDKPSNFALRFLAWFCPTTLYEGIEGDLIENFKADIKQIGEKRARRRFIWNVVKFFRPDIVFRNRFSLQLMNTIMIGNYMKVASRNILKRKLYSFINAFGLSVALAFCALIYLFIQDEKSFDQFHENKEQIYRIHAVRFNAEKNKAGDKYPFDSDASLPAKLGDVLLDEFAEVSCMTRFTSWNKGIMRYEQKSFNQKFTCVDSGFFKVFSFKILAGDPVNPLRSSSSAVLTPETAKKYFGTDDAVGKIFTLELQGQRKDMKVAAIIEPPPANSSITYDMLVSMEVQPWFAHFRNSWGTFSYPTFIRINPNADMHLFKTHLDTLCNTYLNEQFKDLYQNTPIGTASIELNFMNISDIHLSKDISWEKGSDPQYSWILSGIAVLILIIACINYISLTLTASAARRIEIGIRKVVGAQKKQVAWQFSCESILLALFSMLIGLGLVFLFLPFFNEFTKKDIALGVIETLPVIGFSFLITIVVGLVAGSYPSMFLSRILPAVVLKGRLTSKLHIGFTKPLVTFQFFLSALLIICSVVMYRQMIYISTRDLGFDKQQVIAIPTQTGWNAKASQTLHQLRNELRNEPSILGISGVSNSFNKGQWGYSYKVGEEYKTAFIYYADTEYIPMLDIKLVQGRNFDGNIPSDSAAVIVNEALVRDLGWKDPLNEYLNWKGDTLGRGSPVIGVAKNYHFRSLEHTIEPLFISLNRTYLTTLLVKITPGNISEKVNLIRNTWKKLYPDRPFEYSFIDDDVNAQYDMHQRWSKIMGLSTIFSIIIACLGLFGLAGINAVNRTKEIGIRKVMGAQISNIFILLNRQYVILAGIAFAFAAPVSWYMMNQWLSSFQYKIKMGWELFAMSMLAGLTVALITVSYHGIKAALINPADTLKHE